MKTHTLGFFGDNFVIDPCVTGVLICSSASTMIKRTPALAKVMKQISGHTKTETEGVDYVRAITNKAGHIFREVLVKDVGIDANIELCNPEKVPSGKKIGVQIKSGESHFDQEDELYITYYPEINDLKYWQAYQSPVFIILYRPSKEVAYWADVKEQLSNDRLEEFLTGLKTKKLLIKKSNLFDTKFLDGIKRLYAGSHPEDDIYYQFLESFKSPPKDDNCIIPVKMYELMKELTQENSIKIVSFLESKKSEIADNLTRSSYQGELSAIDYVEVILTKLKEHIFTTENTGFVFIAFEDKGIRDKIVNNIETFINRNRYIALKGERVFSALPMNHIILIAIDDWDKDEEGFALLLDELRNQDDLTWSYNYEWELYPPVSASQFFTSKNYLELGLETVLDTGDQLTMFETFRNISKPITSEQTSKTFWFSIGKRRIKLYYEWDPELYNYFHIITEIRANREWSNAYDFFLEWEFEISNEKSLNDFINTAKNAKSLEELPLMTKSMLRSIEEGMSWGKDQYLES